MYHFILLAVLANGQNYQASEQYYGSKSECLNKTLAYNDGSMLNRYKSVCHWIESEWFPDEDMLKNCKEKIDPIIKYDAKCIKE